MSHWMKGAFALMLALGLGLGVQAAQAAQSAVAPCSGDEVTGVVVDVDEDEGVITIDTGTGGLCTVTVAEGDYDHPIVALLGTYFSRANPDDLADALKTATLWVVCPATGPCTLAEEGDTGAVEVRVTDLDEDSDGDLTAEFLLPGTTTPRTVEIDEPDFADELEDALDELTVAWSLDEDSSSVVDAGEEIEALREDGLGFGVIVKLYAMAAESQEACADEADETGEAAEDDEACALSVEDLAEEFQSGVGLGQLFQEYGKPSMLGVGHVRKALRQEAAATEDADEVDDEEDGDGDDGDDPDADVKCPPNTNNNKPGCGAETGTTTVAPDVKNTGKPDKDNGKPADKPGKPDKNTGKPGRP